MEVGKTAVIAQNRSFPSAAMSMTRALVLLSVLACTAYIANAMVPLPQKFTYGQNTVTLSRAASWSTLSKSEVLNNAIARIRGNIFLFPSTSWPTNYQVTVETQSDDENLQFGVGASPVFMYHRIFCLLPLHLKSNCLESLSKDFLHTC